MLDRDKFRAEVERRIAERVSSMPEERAANQAGRLTDGQQRRFADGIRTSFTVPLILVAVFLIFPCIGVVFLVANPDQKPNLLFDLLFGGLAALLLLILGAMLLRRAWLLQEVKAGQLQRAAGQVSLHGDAYRVQVPGHKLDLADYSSLGAGDYDFSFLPRSRRVVAAERTSPALSRDELLNALAATNHFSLHDLAAYREGNLGLSGVRQMFGATSTVVVLLISGALAIATGFLMVSTLLHVPRQPLSTTLLDLAIIAIPAIVFIYVALNATWSILKLALDLLSGKVASAEGKVVTGTYYVSGSGRTGGSTRYYYSMEGRAERWYVSKTAYRALVDGQKYRGYYLPHSKTLVGIEPIADGPST